MNLRTAPATLLLGTVGLLLLAAIGWLTLIGPAFGAIGETDEARVEAQDRNATLQLQLTQLRRQAEELPDTRHAAERLDRIFPPTADQPGFLAEIVDAAGEAGIGPTEVTAISSGVPTVLLDESAEAAAADPATGEGTASAGGDVAVQAVTVSATGSYPELRSFLHGVEQMDRALLVQSVTVSTADEGTLALTLTGTTFVAPPLGDPPAGS